MKISVVMPAYNSELTIGAAISSILQQTYKDFEFLIVNDGSTDQTEKIINAFDDPRIKILHNSENIGLTRSLNKAISISTGQYIARQDADDISLPERFQKQIEFMSANPDIALLGTSRATLNSSGVTIATNKLPKEPTHQDLLKKNHFVHGSVMLRREILDEVGFYNELFRQSQDYELWLRISHQHRVMNLQEPLYGVRRHSNRVTLTRLPQAMLFKLMAIHLARGIVSPETLDLVRCKGIESYYEILSLHNKLKFHQKAARKYAKHKLYREAEYHSKILIKLDPYSIKAILIFAYVKLKLRT